MTAHSLRRSKANGPKQKRAHLRWSMAVSEKDGAPRGRSECVREAVDALDPAKLKSKRDSVFTPRAADWREHAALQVSTLAKNYNRDSIIVESAPRLSSVIRQLEDLRSQVFALAGRLKLLDDYSRLLLQTHGTGIEGVSLLSFPDADIDGLPRAGESSDADQTTSWVKRLTALGIHAHHTSETAKRNFGRGPLFKDRGGQTSPFRQRYGTANWRLVIQGWEVFEAYRPGAATGTLNGPFHEFLKAVLEFATGEDPEETTGLLTLIKSLMPLIRQFQKLRAQAQIAQAKLEAASPTDAKRRAKLTKQIADLERQLEEAWANLHCYTER